MAQEKKKETKNKEEGESKKESTKERSQRNPSIRDELGRLFDQDFWLEPADFFRRTQRMLSRAGFAAFPRIDISETDKEVKITADLPGIDPDDVDIEIHGDWMRISGEVERETETNERPYRYERSYGSFRRSFLLPALVKKDEARAVYKNGTLTVTIPKEEEEKREKIKIERR